MPASLLLFLPLVGCADVLDALDTTPARVEVVAPAEAVLDGSPRAVAAHVLTKSGKPLPDAVKQLAWSVTPTNVADATGGQLRCLSSGDASVLVTGAGVSTTFTVRCRLVASVDAPTELRLLVGEPGAVVTAAARDASGAVLADVRPTLTSDSPQVFEVSGDAAVARSVGTARLVVEAGGARKDVPVTVVERVNTDTLALEDGASLTYTLTRGRYSVEINVRAADGSLYGVTVSDVGGGCPSLGESTEHRFECTVADTASLVVANPTSWGWGPAETGNLTIYRIP